ncbi:MAG: hypothetical protein OES25_05420 [Acidobacteriota bacterium]|nr:hypothetical protein [Acidobacteriota bacterium]
MAKQPFRNAGPRTAPIWLGVIVFLGLAVAEEPLRQQALAAYDESRCPDALQAFQQLDDQGALDGPLLYRRYFCLNQIGDDGATGALRRAIETLEEEFGKETTLETGFYLGNAYGNIARLSDRAAISAKTVAAIESGETPSPTTPADMFRLGKLYQDLEQTDDARKWFSATVEHAEGQENVTGAYVRHAARFLIEEAAAGGDEEALARYTTAALADGSGTVEDYDRLAVMHARQKNYLAASKAWNKALLLNPSQGNRPRYLTRLCHSAIKLAPLPETDGANRPWAEMNGAELEEVIRRQAEIVAEIMTSTQAAIEAEQPINAEQRADYQSRVDQARPLFVAAAMEYSLQGNSLREFAFFGGFAQLVFRDRDWRVPYPKRKHRKAKKN